MQTQSEKINRIKAENENLRSALRAIRGEYGNAEDDAAWDAWASIVRDEDGELLSEIRRSKYVNGEQEQMIAAAALRGEFPDTSASTDDGSA